MVATVPPKMVSGMIRPLQLGTLGPQGLFWVQQPLQIIGEARLLVGCLLSQCWPLGSNPFQAQCLTQGHQALMLQVHTFTSSRSWYTDSGCCKLSSDMVRSVAVVPGLTGSACGRGKK